MAIQRNVTNGAIAAAILVAIVGALYGQTLRIPGCEPCTASCEILPEWITSRICN